jgi:F-type H+-transporting ATPase subunit epsilon
VNLKVLLPSRIFTEKTAVKRIVVDTLGGSFGVLPLRRDCVAALSPGILCYETVAEGEVFLAVDEGVIVKTGRDVRVSVRRAVGGCELSELRHLVDAEFLTLDEQERSVRTINAKLEAGFLRRFASFEHE